MPPRTRPHEVNRGFTLVEAVIVIAIMAILASAATPMLMRALTQQRARQTRDLVRAAYEALVGTRDRSVPNLITDVGFVPPAALGDLRILTTRTPAGGWPGGAVPLQYPIASVPAGFTWGWNGPYWTGPTQTQTGANPLPVDGWGRLLRWQNNQVVSNGADGVPGNADDLVYPPPPAAAPTQVPVYITVIRDVQSPSPGSATFSAIVVTHRFQQQILPVTLTPAFSPLIWAASNSTTLGPWMVQPGPAIIQITCTVTSPGPIPPPTSISHNQSQTITLALGEVNRNVVFRWNN